MGVPKRKHSKRRSKLRVSGKKSLFIKKFKNVRNSLNKHYLKGFYDSIVEEQ
ncbi:MAG: hypothetical protein QTO32_00515 [Candidatus Organicella extenuata]|jgi:ribosomal protein L32|uniref:50S ribosomal protein L32 n=1 Tax=Candidatus Organicella extenuata TaxID=2841811 RepID=A0AA51BK70_9BACT|nr:MAG: hypothetical protein QTO32_00515 [Candidatus Organicella extenuata]